MIITVQQRTWIRALERAVKRGDRRAIKRAVNACVQSAHSRRVHQSGMKGRNRLARHVEQAVRAQRGEYIIKIGQ